MNINTSFLGCFPKLKKRPKPPTAIVIHHTCTKTPERTRKVLKDQGYSTHYEIDRDGTVYQYADPMEIACHVGSANVHAIGVDITHVSHGEFTEAQYGSYIELMDMLCDRYGIKKEVHEVLEGIWPHGALGNTECPQGFEIRRYVGAIEGVDFDVVRRVCELIGVAIVDGRRDELVAAIHAHFPRILTQ